ncbi:S8 family serine peptidase [Bacteroides sp. 224]|uniref:S8 family peptidase n=1 Tax=Bacteroides sp. 224 TaxID=2302936 RepID=UPI0013D302F3|nr:S8 family serine peptidase [Bacteroides sp. 224]NDV66488.1 serine protease [Bacteroides sp. 224]
MKRAILFIWALAALTAFAQQDSLKYRIYLKDKVSTTYSLDRPSEFLSLKAIERRMKQQLPIDSTDLPVCQNYIEAIQAKGVRIVAKGKWENFVTVSCSDTIVIDRIMELPFVASAKKVWRCPSRVRNKAIKRDSLVNKAWGDKEDWHGNGHKQIAISNGHKLHEAGFKGEGMSIAVIDDGYHNVDIIPVMSNIRILGTHDFVTPGGDVFAAGNHGLAVLSCIAMNQPYKMVGTAPEASYWLLRSEDSATEQPVEEDYWANAIEFADSVGVDVVNTSLGYFDFDDPFTDYRLRDLTGKYAMISRQAAHVANKGMVLVCSAGNAGSSSWKKLTPPSDAEHVLTVGAIAKNGKLASFSSVGNTTDNRIKPDVVAVGVSAAVVATDGQPSFLGGTSFSSPIVCGMVTCLWQALPHLTAKELIEVIRRSGDRLEYPDNIYGYGVPDMWKAYELSLPL